MFNRLFGFSTPAMSEDQAHNAIANRVDQMQVLYAEILRIARDNRMDVGFTLTKPDDVGGRDGVVQANWLCE